LNSEGVYTHSAKPLRDGKTLAFPGNFIDRTDRRMEKAISLLLVGSRHWEHSGVFVVECTLDLGIQTLRAHCDEEFALMDTLQILTATRIAMFFRWPDAGLPASRRATLAEGVHVRKAGGFIELPLAGDDSYD
jgi:hypothetical protein